jgi:hypothetical protein
MLYVLYYSSYLPAYEDGTGCSEKSVYKIQKPGNYPEENIQTQMLPTPPRNFTDRKSVLCKTNQESLVGILTGKWASYLGFESRNGQENLFCHKSSRPDVGSKQRPSRGVPHFLLRGRGEGRVKYAGGVMLTTHLRLASYTSILLNAFWHGQEKLYIFT